MVSKVLTLKKYQIEKSKHPNKYLLEMLNTQLTLILQYPKE